MPALHSPFIRVGHISSWHMPPLVLIIWCSSVNDVTATWLLLNSSKRLLGTCLKVVARRAWKLSFYQRWLIAIAGSVRPQTDVRY